jgi:beta-lactamase class A
MLLLFLNNNVLLATGDSLRLKIEQVARSIDGKVGVAMLHLNTKDTLTLHGTGHFPMQSVYKFPLAITVLNLVDQGKLSLEQKIHISKEDVHSYMWSPMGKKYPEGGVDLTLREVLQYTVSHSDNNACDILFRLLGGAGVVERYVHALGIKDIAIANTEEELHQEWDVQFANWATPVAMVRLLEISFRSEVLSKQSRDILWTWMVEASTGPKRIKAGLPAGTIVAHRPGTSGVSNGVMAATNDIGIVTLPDGKQVAVAVFVTNSKEPMPANEKVIAKITGLIYDHYRGAGQ